MERSEEKGSCIHFSEAEEGGREGASEQAMETQTDREEKRREGGNEREREGGRKEGGGRVGLSVDCMRHEASESQPLFQRGTAAEESGTQGRRSSLTYLLAALKHRRLSRRSWTPPRGKNRGGTARKTDEPSPLPSLDYLPQSQPTARRLEAHSLLVLSFSTSLSLSRFPSLPPCRFLSPSPVLIQSCRQRAACGAGSFLPTERLAVSGAERVQQCEQ